MLENNGCQSGEASWASRPGLGGGESTGRREQYESPESNKAMSRPACHQSMKQHGMLAALASDQCKPKAEPPSKGSSIQQATASLASHTRYCSPQAGESAPALPHKARALNIQINQKYFMYSHLSQSTILQDA